MARFALAQGVPQAVVQKNGDLVRLAPGEPKKLDEVRVGRLVLDGDVILPADGATMNERRRIGGQRADRGRAAGRRGTAAWPASRAVRPFGVPVEEDRDDFLADAIDAGDARLRRRQGRGQDARSGAARGAPLRDRCGPARSRWSR